MSRDLNKADLDNYITGHWGEDQFRDEPEERVCPDCGGDHAFCPEPEEESHPGPISEAASHLRIALSQMIPSDDQIIAEHIREALKLLESAYS